MPRFEPFTGLRYDPLIPLDEVVAPPYDVVTPEERTKLASRHRANSIHVELPVDEAPSGLDRYQAAARLLGSWVQEGLLRRDEAPSMYAYRMTGPAGDTTTGVIGALACEPSDGDVVPHEQTVSKDIGDRLELLRACHANLSPIWGLSLTEGLTKAYEPMTPPQHTATDDSGTVHQLWVIDDPAAIDSIAHGVTQTPVVIADGHHRYETALAYQAERRAETDDAPGDYDLVMTFIVELTEAQLSVGAVHRVLSRVPPGIDLLEVMRRWFDCELVGDVDRELAGELVRSGTLTLITRDGTWALTPRPEACRVAESTLDSSLVALALDEVANVVPTYSHDWHDAVRAVIEGSADATLLLRPVTVAQISQWAHERKRMPPKSTHFHPKPRTGMVFRPMHS